MGKQVLRTGRSDLFHVEHESEDVKLIVITALKVALDRSEDSADCLKEEEEVL